MTEKVSNRRPVKTNFLLMGTGTLFTAMAISGFLVGYVFDELLDTRPIAMLICGALGMIGGMMKVHEVMGQTDRSRKEEEKEHRADGSAAGSSNGGAGE